MTGEDVLFTKLQNIVSSLGNSAAIPIAPVLFSETKLDFQFKLKRAQEQYNIPDNLIINFDQTLLAQICGSNRTMGFEGVTCVLTVGKGKKQQITGTFTVNNTGLFLTLKLT